MLPAPPFQLLERYDVVEEIGRGGHAVVFRAHDRQLARDVAIKVLREDVVGSADVVKRFMQEIQLLATLEHAHILHVHDSGTVDGQPFVVMELAPQATLARRLTREAQLPIADAVQIAREVGSALAHAHARGILHRDVKPENILLGAGGAVLADFGIARVTGEHDISRITSTGEAVGTLQYMSPEQLCAEPIDARSDQYALGLVFYEMLSGVRPHAAPTIDALRALRVTGQHVALSVYRSAVSPALEAIIARMMAVAPADRFRSLDEFLMALSVLGTAESPTGSGGYEVVRTPSGSRPAVGTPSAGVSAPVSVANDARKKRWVVASAIVATLVAGVSIAQWADARGDDGGPATPGARVVRLASTGDSLSERVRARVRDELAAWSGVEVRDGGRGGVQVSTTVTRLDDSVQVRLQVRDSAGAAPRDVRRMIATRALDSATGVTASMTREILAGRSLDSLRGLDGIPTRSLPALRAYVRGFDLLYDGQLDSASAAFRAARDAAPGFAAAHLWAAQSAAWARPKDSVAWYSDVRAALRQSSSLDSGSALLTRALDAMARQAYPQACDVYREAEKVGAIRFEAMMGLGECQRVDDGVIAVNATPKFRASMWSAVRAYERAIAAAPSDALMSRLYPAMIGATFSSGSELRHGVASGKTYIAYPELSGDSLAFLPIDSARFVSRGADAIPHTWSAALVVGRNQALGLALAWRERFPKSVSARLAHALSLEVAGRFDSREPRNATAILDEIDLASVSPSVGARVAVARVRLALRRGAIGDALRHAELAVSTQALTRDRDARRQLVGLAALTGLRSDPEQWTFPEPDADASLPPAISSAIHGFATAAWMDDCTETRKRHSEAERAIAVGVPPSERERVRLQWMRPIVRWSIPCLGPSTARGFPPEVPLDVAVLQLAAGDIQAAARTLRSVRSSRDRASGGSISWDIIYAEATASLAAADTSAAIASIVEALDDLSGMSSFTTEVPYQAAGLRDGMRLLLAIPSFSAASSTVRRLRLDVAVGRSQLMNGRIR